MTETAMTAACARQAVEARQSKLNYRRWRVSEYKRGVNFKWAGTNLGSVTYGKYLNRLLTEDTDRLWLMAAIRRRFYYRMERGERGLAEAMRVAWYAEARRHQPVNAHQRTLDAINDVLGV